MKNIKKFTILGLVISFLFLFSACGKKLSQEDQAIQDFISKQNDTRQAQNDKDYIGLQTLLEESIEQYGESLEFNNENINKKSRKKLGQATFKLDAMIKSMPKEIWNKINENIIAINVVMENKEDKSEIDSLMTEIKDLLAKLS